METGTTYKDVKIICIGVSSWKEQVQSEAQRVPFLNNLFEVRISAVGKKLANDFHQNNSPFLSINELTIETTDWSESSSSKLLLVHDRHVLNLLRAEERERENGKVKELFRILAAAHSEFSTLAFVFRCCVF